MAQAKLNDLFAGEAPMGVKVFAGGVDRVNTEHLSIEEANAVRQCFDRHINHLAMISPKLAALFRPQKEAMVKWAAVAKGSFPETKTITYPSQGGGLGVDFLNPYLYRYKGTADATDPCYSTAYTVNTWNAELTAGSIAYLAGDGTNYYKGKATTDRHSMNVIFQDGIVEFNSTPSIKALAFKTDKMSKYAPIANPTAVDQSIEDGKLIYPYLTPGMIPMMHNHGVEIAVLPSVTNAAADIRLFGMCFYEHDFYGALAARV